MLNDSSVKETRRTLKRYKNHMRLILDNNIKKGLDEMIRILDVLQLAVTVCGD